MRRFLVMFTLLVPSIALAKQPADRRVFSAELAADDAPPPYEMRRIPSRLELHERLRLPTPVETGATRFGGSIELRIRSDSPPATK